MRSDKSCAKRTVIFIIASGMVLVLVLSLAVFFTLERIDGRKGTTNGNNSESVSEQKSPTGSYRYATVASDAAPCSTIGTDILAKKRGSAVDAAIATVLCVGVVNTQSCGIGGGHFMTIYDFPRENTSQIFNTILARERAPLNASRDMYVNGTASSLTGGMAIGVPGEIAGFYQEWQKFGKIPWADLFLPTIQLCRDGYEVNGALAYAIQSKEDVIRADESLSELFVKADGSIYKEGDILKRPKLAITFQKIADDPQAFYNPNSQLAKDIIADIEDYGGIITLDDLRQYTVYDKEPLHIHLHNSDMTAYGPAPPSSGVVLQYILNILDGYKFSRNDYSDQQSKNLAYHRIIEAFKFAYAKRSELGDEDFVPGIQELLTNLTSDDFAEFTRSKITDGVTHDIPYYEPAFGVIQDSGTSHTSILAPDGSAVAITSTINTSFGSKVRGKRTGIIFNNEMDDFSTPGTVNAYGVPASPSNFIAPRKMPMSSMCPTIIIDDKTRQVKFISGASGGTKITTAVAYVTIHTLWFNMSVDTATDMSRLHHQLAPNEIRNEPRFDAAVSESLKSKGHKIIDISSIAVVQSIHNTCNQYNYGTDCIHSASDRRKRMAGKPDGF